MKAILFWLPWKRDHVHSHRPIFSGYVGQYVYYYRQERTSMEDLMKRYHSTEYKNIRCYLLPTLTMKQNCADTNKRHNGQSQVYHIIQVNSMHIYS